MPRIRFHDEYIPATQRMEKREKQIIRMVKQGYKKARRVRELLQERGIAPSDICTFQDFESLPVISREDLVRMEMEDPPFGGFFNPEKKIDRIFISPGPVYEPHLSEKDTIWARAYHAAGIGENDVVLNAFSYHMVAAGLTFHGGLRYVGATVIPSGTSSSELQVQLLRNLGVTAYTGTPSFLMSIIQKSEEMGYQFTRDFKLRRACFAAEPLPPTLRNTFEKVYAIDTYQMYGATEVGDVAFECSQKNGWHICEEVYVEIVDPATGKGVPPGCLGEVVVTRLNDIFYLLRFGTGDLSRLSITPCPCGRTSYRLEGIAGRIGEAVKVRGMFVAPSQLKKVSERFNNRKIQLRVSRPAHEDILTVRFEMEPGHETGGDDENQFRQYFRDICSLRIDHIEFVEPGSLEGEKLIVDERSWK